MKDEIKNDLKPIDKTLRDLTDDVRRCKIVRNALQGFLTLESQEHAESIFFAIKELKAATDQLHGHVLTLRGVINDALVLVPEQENTEPQPDGQSQPIEAAEES